MDQEDDGDELTQEEMLTFSQVVGLVKPIFKLLQVPSYAFYIPYLMGQNLFLPYSSSVRITTRNCEIIFVSNPTI